MRAKNYRLNLINMITKKLSMQLAYKYPCYPNRKQAAQLDLEFAAARAVYNWGLATRIGEYKEHHRTISYASKPDGLNKRLTQLKKKGDRFWPLHMGDSSWLNQASNQCLQNSLRNLDAAYRNFFRWVRKGGKIGYPSFKKKGYCKDAVTYNLVHCTYLHDQQKLWLGKQAARTGFLPLKIGWDRRLPSCPKSVTVSRNRLGDHFVSFPVEIAANPLPGTGISIGIETGDDYLIVTSEGETREDLHHSSRYDQRLTMLRRQLSRKKKHSSNWQKQHQRIIRMQKKIDDRHLTFLHQSSAKLVQQADLICVARVNHSPMAELLRQLTYKAELRGRELIKINRAYASADICYECGYQVPEPTCMGPVWRCPQCGANHDRDVNAALNIKREGLRILAEFDAEK